jgi:hypothetical protein
LTPSWGSAFTSSSRHWECPRVSQPLHRLDLRSLLAAVAVRTSRRAGPAPTYELAARLPIPASWLTRAGPSSGKRSIRSCSSTARAVQQTRVCGAACAGKPAAPPQLTLHFYLAQTRHSNFAPTRAASHNPGLRCLSKTEPTQITLDCPYSVRERPVDGARHLDRSGRSGPGQRRLAGVSGRGVALALGLVSPVQAGGGPLSMANICRFATTTRSSGWLRLTMARSSSK